MCSCCCLLFPIAVFASQHGDFGIAAELRCHGSGLCCRTVYTWDLESLSVVSLSPIYSTFLSGFLWCNRGYQHLSLCLSVSLSLHHPQKYTHIRNETHILENKIHVHTSACASVTTFLFPSPHFIFSLVVSTSFPLHSHVGVQIRHCGIPRSPESPGIHHCLHFTLKHSSAFHWTVLQILIT